MKVNVPSLSVCVVGMALVSGVASFRFSIGAPLGWNSYQNGIPCALSKWSNFPLVTWEDFPDWSQLMQPQSWPLGLHSSDDWGNGLVDEPGSHGDNVHSRECDSGRQRLEQLYQESLERSRKAQEEVEAIEQRLEELRTSRMREKPTQDQRNIRDTPQACAQNRHEQQNPRPTFTQQGYSDFSNDHDFESNPPTRAPRQPQQQHQLPRQRAHGGVGHDQPRLFKDRPIDQDESEHRYSRPTSHRQPADEGFSRHQEHQSSPRHADLPTANRRPNEHRRVPPEPAQRQSPPTSPKIRHNPSPSLTEKHSNRANRYTQEREQNTYHHQRKHKETVPKTVSEIEEVMLIPTRGFNPRDIKISHHGNHIRVHASRTCSPGETCVSREMETSYELPFPIVKGSMKASVNGDDIVIKGRRGEETVQKIVIDSIDDSPLISESYDSDKDSGVYESAYDNEYNTEWAVDDNDL